MAHLLSTSTLRPLLPMPQLLLLPNPGVAVAVGGKPLLLTKPRMLLPRLLLMRLFSAPSLRSSLSPLSLKHSL
jgi:hypothetical protein